MMNTISWNVRGVKKKASRIRLKELVKLNDVCLVSLLKPKLLLSKLQSLCVSLGFSSYMANPLAEKHIWILWDHRVKINVIAVHEQTLTIEVSFLGSLSFFMTFVYEKM